MSKLPDLQQMYQMINDTWAVVKAYYDVDPTEENAAELTDRMDDLFRKHGRQSKQIILWALDCIEKRWEE